jgi:hypothetical protein
MKPSPETIALLEDVQGTLNKHDLSYRESFMVLMYLTVAVARAGGMQLDNLQEIVADSYEIDMALDQGVQ